jgi:hypothetical protein
MGTMEGKKYECHPDNMRTMEGKKHEGFQQGKYAYDSRAKDQGGDQKQDPGGS